LFTHDFDHHGFEWIDCHDAEQSVISYRRKDDHQDLIIVLNFTPVVRGNYRIGVPAAGSYKEIFNSDAGCYDGTQIANGSVVSEPIPWMNQPYSVSLTLPPLAGIILKVNNGK
jgi:1,4-alpha-glucan branching enzyme